MDRIGRRMLKLCVAILIIAWTTTAISENASAQAETGGSVEAEKETVAINAAQPDAYVAAPASAVHNLWMLVASALVMFMTAPGLAMFYGGLVRKKNVLSVVMQCMFLMGLMTVWWALFGYSFTFGGTGVWFGNGDFLFLRGVGRYWDTTTSQPMTPMFDVHLPRLTHMLFQGMFFIITPAIICGSFAERMRFGAMVLFSLLWGTLVYCPLAHWVWSGGILAYGKGWAGGSLDFAGGTVVHVSSGVTALVAAYVIGPRLGHRQEPMPPHNLTYTALGASMLWFGWFGFNAGSALRVDGIATNAFVVTHLCAAAGALSWAGIEWLQRRKPTVLGASSGAVAGLVCITPAAGHVGPMSAIVMGLLVGVLCYFACSRLKSILGYDDSLDAFGIHGVGGTVGAILTGVFATRTIWNLADGQPLGLVDGNWKLMLGQLLGLVIAWLFVGGMSFILLKALDVTIGLRVNSTMERQGLDVTQHGEEGYIFL